MTIKPEFIIFSTPYHPNDGGAIVLHYLCHLLNQSGVNASIIPSFNCLDVSPYDDLLETIGTLNQIKKNTNSDPFTLNADWKTPLYPHPLEQIKFRNDLVVVYPEVTFGNPLRARHIARWILHKPGFHNKHVYYEPGEVHFRYLEMHHAVPMPWIEISDQLLSIFYIPWDHYKPALADQQREGTAYLVRKGTGKKAIHDVTNSIQIDGKSHSEIGEIFRRVKTFISYDTKSIYSLLAAVAGADSVVAPDDGISEDMWQPFPELRAGLAYGFERLGWAQSTRHQTAEQLQKLELQSAVSVQSFVAFWTQRLQATL